MQSVTPEAHAELERAPLPALFETARELMIEELQQRLAEEGYDDIRPAHGCVFRHVNPDGSRLTELAHRAELTKQAVGEVVDELEDKGYVERAPDPRDRRAKIIRPTRRGKATIATAERIFADIEARWASDLGARRVAELRDTLERAVAGASTRAAA